MPQAWIGLGGNQGDVSQTLDEAIVRIGEIPGVVIEAQSSYYATSPQDYTEQDDFINAVVRVSVEITPESLLKALQKIESELGRIRGAVRFGPRRVDLDLLLYGSIQQDTECLVLPHPRMHQRRFVLEPLAEIDPGLCIPGHGAIEALLAATADQSVTRCTEHSHQETD